jgi:hypothetical protein
VGGEGIEPSSSCEHWILSPARLPVPPPARKTLERLTVVVLYNKGVDLEI